MPADGWTEARLIRLIDEKIRESASLDYKQSRALAKTGKAKLDLSKDVSAFANAGGGTLIYGIAENERQEPDGLDEGIDPLVISKEWLDDVISSGIQRKVEGVRIHVVDLTGERAGRVAYVIEIPQSMRAPHMSADHKYYKRHNFKSEPMEDYEVRDVALRGSAPRLRATFTFGYQPGEQPQGAHRLPLRVILINDGNEPAMAAQITIDFDGRLNVGGPGSAGRDSISVDGRESQFLPVERYIARWVAPHAFPVFAGAPADVTLFALEPFEPENLGPFAIWWKIATPGAPETRGAAWFGWDATGSITVDDVTEEELFVMPGVKWCRTGAEAFSLHASLRRLKAESRI